MQKPGVLYACLCFLRVALVLAPGYIHPDEFFQGGQELFASRLLGVRDTLTPWEFLPSRACRSPLPPLLLSGGAFVLLRALGLGYNGCSPLRVRSARRRRR